MLNTLTVQNCFHFMVPTPMHMWRGCDVPGVMGVLAKDTASGQYNVIDAFDVEQVPDLNSLAADPRLGAWMAAAGGLDNLRFDVFLMPNAETPRRRDVVTLLQRSCGFTATPEPAYAHAV